MRAAPHGALVDHVAGAAQPSAPGETTGRRFLHRSLREFLVAEHLASLPAPVVAETLLLHLWCDDDWDYAVPLAIAVHPDRSAVIRGLVAAIGPAWQSEPFNALGRLLAVVAGQAMPDDFDDDVVRLIDTSRQRVAEERWSLDWVQTITSGRRWTASNQTIVDAFLGQMRGRDGVDLATVVAQLDASPQQRSVACGLLLDHLNHDLVQNPGDLGPVLVRLAVTTADRTKVRDHLLALDTYRTVQVAELMAQLDPTPQDRAAIRQRILDKLDRIDLGAVGDVLARLAPTPGERADVRQRILDYLPNAHWMRIGDIGQLLVPLTTGAEERSEVRHELLELVRTSRTNARYLATLLPEFDPNARQRAEARRFPLDRFKANPWSERNLLEVLNPLAPSSFEREAIRRALIDHLADVEPNKADEVADLVVALDPRTEELEEVRQYLIGHLDNLNRLDAGLFSLSRVASRIASLGPTTRERIGIRQLIMDNLTLASTSDRTLGPIALPGAVDALAQLDPTSDERVAACRHLVDLLGSEAWQARDIGELLWRLARGSDEQAEVRRRLVALLGDVDARDAVRISRLAVEFVPTPDERSDLLRRLIKHVTDASPWSLDDVVGMLAELAGRPEDLKEARRRLVDRLAESNLQPPADIPKFPASSMHVGPSLQVVASLLLLGPTPDESAKVRRHLIDRVLPHASSHDLEALADLLLRLDATPQERAAIRHHLRRRIQRDPEVASLFDQTGELARLLVSFARGPDERAEARTQLLDEPNLYSWDRYALVARLAITHSERKQTRRQLLDRLRSATPDDIEAIANALVELDPTPADRAEARRGACQPF